jgi:hypothetical protein
MSLRLPNKGISAESAPRSTSDDGYSVKGRRAPYSRR